MKICGSLWKIKEISFLVSDECEKISGETDPDKREILIESESTDQQKKEIFLHEYGHAICFELGLEDEDVESWIEHSIINGYAKDMLRNRKFFAKFFM